jgi:hypothetical protein
MDTEDRINIHMRELPPRARDRQRCIEQNSLDSDGKRRALHDANEVLRLEQSDIQARIMHAERDIERMGAFYRESATRDPSNPHGEVIDRERIAVVETLQARLTEIREKRRENEAAAEKIPRSLIPTIEEYFGGQPIGRKWQDATLPTVKPQKGETARDAVFRTRVAHKLIAAELSRIERAPRTRGEAAALMHRKLAAVVAKGKPSLSDLYRGGRIRSDGTFSASNPRAEIGWPFMKIDVPTSLTEGIPNGLAFSVWLHQDLVLERMDALLNERDDALSIAEADKPALIADCKARILAAARLEEEAVLAAKAAGFVIERRKDVSAIVLLGIEPAPD